MCIIVCKERGKAGKLDWDLLKNCFVNNPDGAGYAVAWDDKIRMRKGFMTFDAFKQSLQDCVKKIDLKECGILLHFRITTHGGTHPENTHPFPLDSGGVKDLKCGKASAVLAMNGICNSNVSYKDTLSDTMDAVQSIIAPLYRDNGRFWEKPNGEHLFEWLGAKWAILTNDGKIWKYGDFHEKRGWSYSNTSYNKKTYTYYYPVGSYSTITSTAYGLKEYIGEIKNTDTGEVRKVTAKDDYYLDDENILWLYDWRDDDFYILENVEPIIKSGNK